MTRRGWMAAAALSLAGLLAGCGGGAAATRSTASGPKTTTPSPARTSNWTEARGESYWPYQKLVRNLSGRRVVVHGNAVRLNRVLLECNGRGASKGSGYARRWASYTCTETQFRGGVDQDVTFDVAILSPKQLKITTPRYGPF